MESLEWGVFVVTASRSPPLTQTGSGLSLGLPCLASLSLRWFDFGHYCQSNYTATLLLPGGLFFCAGAFSVLHGERIFFSSFSPCYYFLLPLYNYIYWSSALRRYLDFRFLSSTFPSLDSVQIVYTSLLSYLLSPYHLTASSPFHSLPSSPTSERYTCHIIIYAYTYTWQTSCRVCRWTAVVRPNH